MAENTEMAVKTEKKQNAKTPEKKSGKTKSWFKGLKIEFKKIIWPDKKTLAKQTVAVIVTSVLLGGVIAVTDALIQYGINFIVG